MQRIHDKRVLLLGDSLGKGVVWDAERARYGYAEQTAATVAQCRLGCSIDNRSRFGSTATAGCRLLDTALSSPPAYDAALLEFGGNDCNFDWAAISSAPDARHDPNTRPAQFADALQSMISRLRDAGIRPVLTTLPPIDPERYFRFLVGDRLNAENLLGWLGDVWQIYRFQEMYSLIIADIAHSMQVRLLDLRVRCLAVPGFIRDYICADGLHLNALGQQFAGEQLADLASSYAGG